METRHWASPDVSLLLRDLRPKARVRHDLDLPGLRGAILPGVQRAAADAQAVEHLEPAGQLMRPHDSVKGGHHDAVALPLPQVRAAAVLRVELQQGEGDLAAE